MVINTIDVVLVSWRWLVDRLTPQTQKTHLKHICVLPSTVSFPREMGVVSKVGAIAYRRAF